MLPNACQRLLGSEMTSFQNGTVKFHLNSPLIPGRRLTFDGVISGILYERTGDGPAAAECPLIDRRGSVFQASQAFFEADAASMPVSVTGALLLERMKNPGMAEMIDSTMANSYWRVDKGPYQNFVNEYVAYDTKTVTFFVRGDLRAIARLLKAPKVHSIGTLRKKGFGGIESVEVRQTSSTNPNYAIAGNGLLLRPVPLDEMGALGNVEHTKGTETFRPPYHRKEDAMPCALPPFVVAKLDSLTLARIAL